jgi:succinate dehydrogenase hydrophobic anchor subunit
VNGVSQISQDYKETHGRKIIDNTHNVLALLSNPNRIALAVYFIVILAIVGMAFIIIMIVTRKKRKERRVLA